MVLMGWKRCIAHVDMDAFFASIEQKLQPCLHNQPVAITNGGHGSCIITCSYEARAFGVKTGMRLSEARQLCSNIQQCPSRPEVYAETSQKVMEALREYITPDIEIYSVDEAFLDLSKVHVKDKDPQLLARRIQACIYEAVGLPASVGVSGDKTTAKFAAKKAKPKGVWVIPPHCSGKVLSTMPVDKLCGIGVGIQRFLAKHGVHTCGGVAHLPVHILANRFGHGGKRIWLMCQGMDPDPINKVQKDPKSMGHGKVLPPGLKDRSKLKGYLSYMAFKLSCRLQQNGLWARKIWVGLSTMGAHHGIEFPLQIASHDYPLLQKLVEIVLSQCWSADRSYQKIQITATELTRCRQPDLFSLEKSYTGKHQQELDKLLNKVNDKYGFSALRPASLQALSSPDVIAPSWKPSGHRQTIPRMGQSDLKGNVINK